MKKNYIRLILIVLVSFIGVLSVRSQDTDRILLRGQVLYRNISVPNENVINITTENATITNKNGQFAIAVKVDDELAFTAVNYQLIVIKITPEILKKNRLVVEVNEKVTELDEVVVTPEDQERFIQIKNEEFKEFEYEQDRSSEVENIALSQSERGMQNGLNLANIFRALVKSKKNAKDSKSKLKVSEVMRQVYEDDFFVTDLKIPQDQIDAFLMYCDTRLPEQSLLKKDNEFLLIDFLVTHSKEFRAQLDAKN